jgi:hypothetical protein
MFSAPPLSCLLAFSLAVALQACAQTRGGGVEIVPAPPESRSHVPDGVAVNYGTLFPTAGVHSESSAEPGFYTEPQPLPSLVHALEHGIVVIYYGGDPGDDVLSQLKAWSEEFTGPSDGILVVPEPSLARTVVLTAWEHRQMLDRFDAATAREFIETYRGRGPEQYMR